MSDIKALKDLASGLCPEHYPFMTVSHNPLHGWKSILAWNPTEILPSFADKESTRNFFSRNRKALICGFMSYDLGIRLHGITPGGRQLIEMPDQWFAAYENRAEMINGQLRIHGQQSSKKRPDHASFSTLEFRPLTTRETYNRNLQDIQDHIRKGNVYQANLTHVLESRWNGNNPWELFFRLLDANPVDHAACFLHPEFSVFSLSPEKFISTDNSIVQTEPIKGTRPRGATEKEDALERSLLLQSTKEEAELNMITDLLRNDLGRICQTGSVEVLRHRETMALSSVWHTYSVIRGRLSEHVDLPEALLSMIPGGSITGCPKKRAIEIINDLEPFRRGLYTGTMGISYPDGSSDWNIAIRTLLYQDNRLFLGVGGGITIDSNPEDEYNETLAKAKSITEISP